MVVYRNRDASGVSRQVSSRERKGGRVREIKEFDNDGGARGRGDGSK